MKARNLTLEKLETAFERIARITAEKYDIKIVASGHQLCTDGETIYFPWNSDTIDEIPQQVLHGYLDHEVGHIREERRQKEAGRASTVKMIQDLSKGGENTIAMLVNVFEDIRMEIRYSKESIGVAENLKAANLYDVVLFNEKKHRRSKLIDEAKEAIQENFWHKLGCCIITEGFGMDSTYIGEKYVKYVEMCREEIEESKIIEWAEDSLRLARSVYAKISTEEKSKSCPMQEATIVHITGFGIGDLEEASKAKSKLLKQYVPNPESLKRDRWFPAIYGDRTKFNVLQNLVADQTRALRTKLLRRLGVLTAAYDSYDREHGRLDETALSQLLTGDRRVFGTTVPGIKISTAFMIVLDQSGSMGPSSYAGTKSYYAQLSAIALSEALDSLSIPFEVIGFENRYEPVASSDYFVDRAPFNFMIFKSFNENYKKVCTRFIQISGRDDNVDGEALYACALRLAKRPEKRKMMVVFSDGQPACSGTDHRMLHSHLISTVKRITSAGIEVFGVGIQTASVNSYYNEKTGSSNVVINDIKNLAFELFKIISSKILINVKKEA